MSTRWIIFGSEYAGEADSKGEDDGWAEVDVEVDAGEFESEAMLVDRAGQADCWDGKDLNRHLRGDEGLFE